MIKEYLMKWEENKSKLENYIKTNPMGKYDEYKELAKLVVSTIIDDNFAINDDEITVLDHGDYQGTQIIIFHKDTYQPGTYDYIYTSVDYGSCSGCDTLLRVNRYEFENLPDDEQVKDFMSLFMHLFQNFHTMKDN